MKKTRILAALTALLLVMVSGAAGTEDPATPSDLPCDHERTQQTIYFFDGPTYTAVSGISHRVSGPAVVETVCLDCGETLSQETVDNAEDFRPHSFKNGVCALCGYRARTGGGSIDLPGERTVFGLPDSEGMMSLKLTETDLSALEKAKIETLLFRGEEGTVALALGVSAIRRMAEDAAAEVAVEMAEWPDESVFAGVYLDPGTDERFAVPLPETEEEPALFLRFYRTEEPARFAFLPVEAEEETGMEGVRRDEGYWETVYAGEGTYFFLTE